MIRTGGHEVVDIVYTGLDAIRCYRRHKPDVVLMDFAMSKLNGLTACRNILSEDRSGCIFFLSGFGDHEMMKPQFSGARGVLHKPIAWEILERVLEEASIARPALSSAPLA
jgi:CheY-like chemotaxis protein